MEIPYHIFVYDTKIYGVGKGFSILAKYNLELQDRHRERERGGRARERELF